MADDVHSEAATSGLIGYALVSGLIELLRRRGKLDADDMEEIMRMALRFLEDPSLQGASGDAARNYVGALFDNWREGA